MKIKIRETKEEDFEKVTDLLNTNSIWAEFTKEAFKKMLKRNKGFYLVAEKDGQTIGTVFGLHDGGLLGYIYKLAVNKKYQRQKVATRLIDELLKRFKKAGTYWTFAHVYKLNKKGLPFFSAKGFRIRSDLVVIDNWKE